MSGYSAPAFGVLPTGFVKKLTSDLELDLTTGYRTNVDPNLDLSPTEPMGQVMSVTANAAAEIWEILETIYNGTNPNAAEAALLDNVCSITGTKREGATKSRVVVTCNLNASVSIPSGTLINVTGQPNNRWQLLGAGSSTTLFTPGALTSTGAGNYSAVFEATVSGPQVGNAGTITVITAGTVSGLNSVTNPSDAVLGTSIESDTALRARRNLELQGSGGGTTDSIRSAVLQVLDNHSIVGTVFVFENTSNTVDAFARPPHSIEVVVFDGLSPVHSIDNEIAAAMWAHKPAGIPYFSATGDSGTTVDSQGATQIVRFSRAAIVPVYLAYTIVTDNTFDPINGPNAVKAAAAAYAVANLTLGSTVYNLKFRAVPVEASPVKGVVDVSALALDINPSPTATANLPFTARQYPYVTTANIAVTVT